jgi:hypothetical protein
MTEAHLLAERTFSCVFIGVELVMYTTLLGFTVYMTNFFLIKGKRCYQFHLTAFYVLALTVLISRVIDLTDQFVVFLY